MRRDSGRCVLIPDYNVYDYTITEDGEYSYVMENILMIVILNFHDEYSLREEFLFDIDTILSISNSARNF